MMFTAYATEDTSTLSFNECLLATGHNITEYMQTNHSVGVDVVPEVVLRVRLDSDRKLGIEDSHILLHHWVMELFGLSNGDQVDLLHVDRELMSGSAVRSVTLHHSASLSLLNHDEYTSASRTCDSSGGSGSGSGDDFFRVPGVWQTQWPVGVSAASLGAMMSTLLHGACLVEGGSVCINALDNLMVFRTFLNRDEHVNDGTKRISSDYFIVENFETPFEIQCTPPIATAAEKKSDAFICDASVKETTPEVIGFMQSAFDRLSRVVLKTLLTGEWLGPHSALLMSPRGSGKSHFLRHLFAHTRSHFFSNKHGPLFVFSLSGDCIETFSSEDLSTAMPSEVSFSTTEADEVLRLLRLLVGALPSSRDSTVCAPGNYSSERQLQLISDFMNETGELPPICVVIDDADSLLCTPEDSSTSSSTASVNANSMRAAYTLQQLLAILTSPTCTQPLCLLTACSFTQQTDVAPAFLGPPGFEITVTLPLPSFLDRCALLKCFLESGTDGRVEGLASFLGSLPLSFALREKIDDHKDDGEGGGDPLCEIKKNAHVLEWLERASSLMAGYLPADIKNIVKRAMSLVTGHEVIVEGGAHKPRSEQCQLMWSDFLTAITATTPQQLKSVAVAEGGGGIVVESRDSSLSWDNFAGYTEQKECIGQILERSNPLYNRGRKTCKGQEKGCSELSRLVGHHAPKGLVLHGPSGCGKSHMARVIAAECKMNFITVKSTAILSKYFGETEATLRRLFQQARSAAPCVLFFDEFDAIAHNRSQSGDGETSVMARVLSTFLNELDGISSLSGGGESGESEFNVFVLAASESLTSLDQALLRPGRLSHHVKLGLPTKQDIGELFRYFSRKLPLSEDVCVDTIVRLCTERLNVGGISDDEITGPTCAAVSSFCREAVQIALRERIRPGPDSASSSPLDLSGYVVNHESDGRVCRAHFLRALESFVPPPDEVNSCTIPPSLPPFEFTPAAGACELPIATTASNSGFTFEGKFHVGATGAPE